MNRKLPLIALMALIVACAAFPAVAGASGASDRVQHFVDDIIPVLQDPAYASGDQAAYNEQRKQLEVKIDEFFDWTIISQLTLSRAWNDFTPEQQQSFIEAFRYLLENTYMDNIQQSNTEAVNIISETEIHQDKFEVATVAVITDPAKEVPITYRLYDSNGWRVYDVVVEGVSLVGNYRTQFQELLDAHTPAEFIDIVRQKAQEQRDSVSQ